MSTKIKSIQIQFANRNARNRGPTSSKQYNANLRELSRDLSRITSEWNDKLVPLTSELPDGTVDSDIDVYTNGLDGKNLYVASQSTTSSDASYYNTTKSRPNSVYEQFSNVYTEISSLRESVDSTISNYSVGASQVAIEDRAGIYTAENVEIALKEVMEKVNSLDLGLGAGYLNLAGGTMLGSIDLSGYSLLNVASLTTTVGGTVDGRDVSVDGSTQDSHIADATLHFVEGAIDHTNILNIGTNTHAQVDTHIANAAIHPANLNGISDVTLAATTSGQALLYNGSNWANTTLPASVDGGGAANQLTYWSDNDTVTGLAGTQITATEVSLPSSIYFQSSGVGTDSLTLGAVADATGTGAIRVSAGSSVTGTADAAGNYSVAIGYDAWVSAIRGISLGYQAGAAQDAIAIGAYAGGVDYSPTNSVLIGTSATAYKTATGAISLGYSSIVNAAALYGMSLGYDGSVGSSHSYSVALGYQAVTSAANQLRLGNTTQHLNLSTFGYLAMSGIATPSTESDFGQLYCGTDKGLYYQDDTGSEIRLDSGQDHGALSGLADDDHSIYVLADGTRTITGNTTVRATKTGSNLSLNLWNDDNTDTGSHATLNVIAGNGSGGNPRISVGTAAGDWTMYTNVVGATNAFSLARNTSSDVLTVDWGASNNHLSLLNGVFKTVSGESNLPAYTFIDDPDTGLSLVDTDTFGLSASGNYILKGSSDLVQIGDVGNPVRLLTYSGFSSYEMGASPSTETGIGKFYMKTDQNAYFLDGAGNEYDLLESQVSLGVNSPYYRKNGWDIDAIDGLNLSFDDGTRTFTISGLADNSFSYWCAGTQYNKTSPDTVVITDTEGIWFFAYNGATLESSQSEWDIAADDHVPVAHGYWDATNKSLIGLGYETHTWSMDPSTHRRLHATFGAQYSSGLGLSDILSDENGSDDTHAQLSVANGVIYDEDLKIAITDDDPQNLSPVAQLPVYYATGASGYWRKITATNFPISTTGTGRAAWNEWTGATWQVTEVTNNQYTLSHIFATDSVSEPVIVIMGQGEYSTLSAAQAGASTELNALRLNGLSDLAEEFVAVATVIFQTSNAYSNAVQSRIRTTDTGADYVDWRATGGSRAGLSSISDHTLLTNIGTNTHDQLDAHLTSGQAHFASVTDHVHFNEDGTDSTRIGNSAATAAGTDSLLLAAGGGTSTLSGDKNIFLSSTATGILTGSGEGITHIGHVEGTTTFGVGSNYSVGIGYGISLMSASGICIGKFAQTRGVEGISIGVSSRCGTNSVRNIAIGRSTLTASSAVNAIAIGDDATANANYATALGSTATAGGIESIAIGKSVDTGSANGVIAIGDDFTVGATCTNSIAIGSAVDMPAGTTSSIFIGNVDISDWDGTQEIVREAVILGHDTYYYTDSGVAESNTQPVIIGYGAEGKGHQPTAIGSVAYAYGDHGVAIGNNSFIDTDKANCVAIGRSAQCSDTGSTAIGSQSSTGNGEPYTIAVGYDADTTALGQAAIGHQTMGGTGTTFVTSAQGHGLSVPAFEAITKGDIVTTWSAVANNPSVTDLRIRKADTDLTAGNAGLMVAMNTVTSGQNCMCLTDGVAEVTIASGVTHSAGDYVIATTVAGEGTSTSSPTVPVVGTVWGDYTTGNTSIFVKVGGMTGY